MGTRHKTPEVLDAMIEHVRYEAVQLVRFLELGNGWCTFLRPDLARLSSTSILEAGLIHARCLVEFLGDRPATDQVVARDYLPKGWDWTPGGQLAELWQLHGRLAHLGTVRRSVGAEGDFSWESWLMSEAPIILGAFRDFLEQLRETAPQRYELFVQPRAGLPAIDLLPILHEMFD